MLAGEDVYWWGADGESMDQLMGGRRMSAESLVGNFSSQDMVVSVLLMLSSSLCSTCQDVD